MYSRTNEKILLLVYSIGFIVKKKSECDNFER